MIQFFKWLLFVSWWAMPFALMSFFAGHIWFNIKLGWEAGNKHQV